MFTSKSLLEYLKFNTHIEGDQQQIVAFLLKKLLEYYRLDSAIISKIEDEKLLPLMTLNLPNDIADNRSLSFSQMPCGLVVQSMTPLYVNDVRSLDEKVALEITSVVSHISYIGHPLFNHNGNMFGVLSLLGSKKKRFSAESLDLLGSFAIRVALELENANLHSKLTKLKDALEKFTVTDRNTGVYKRSFLSEKLEQEFKRAKRYGRPLSCVMFAVEDYHCLIEDYGVNFTNCVLRELSLMLKNLVREIDFVFRYSPSEFFLILPETSMEQSFVLAERLKYKMESRLFDPREIVQTNESVVFNDKLKSLEEKISLKMKMGLSSYPSNQVTCSAELINISDNLLSQNRGTSDNYVN